MAINIIVVLKIKIANIALIKIFKKIIYRIFILLY